MTKGRSVRAGRMMLMVLAAAFLLIPATAFAATQNGNTQTGNTQNGQNGNTQNGNQSNGNTQTHHPNLNQTGRSTGGSVNQQQINQSCQINGNNNRCTQIAHQSINNNTITRSVPVFRTQRVFSGGPGTGFVQTRRAVRSVVLAHTGLDVLPLLGLGLLLVAAGTGTLVARRRGGLRRFVRTNSAA